MLIEGTLRSQKTSVLTDNYAKLINSGVNPSEILVLCLNSAKKKQFTDSVLEKINKKAFGELKIKTFFGLAYNAVSDNWPLIQDLSSKDSVRILPNLCGLELSRDFLGKSIKISGFKDYFSKINLLHQLFRRNQLRILNVLSDKEFKKRSEILEETFYEDAEKAYNNYRKMSLEYGSFDYLRQISILPFIYKNTDYFKNIKYLFADDADEMTYAELEFIKAISPNLKDKWIAYDRKGASRCGFLSAYKSAVFEFEKIFGEKPTVIEKSDSKEETANKFYDDVISGKKADIPFLKHYSYGRRFEMLSEGFDKIHKLLADGVKLSDITIITPVIDDMFYSFLNRYFASDDDYQIVSGSQKLSDNKFLRSVFTLTKIALPELNLPVEVSEYRSFLHNILGIPVKYSKNAVEDYFKKNKINDIDFEQDSYQESFNKFKSFTDEHYDCKLSDFFIRVYNFCSQQISKSDLAKFNFFIKEIRSFENAYGYLDNETKRSIVSQFQNGIISENPAGGEKICDDRVLIGTPQKIIDFEIKRKYQIWFDISNDLWSMRDIGTLYNAWVFNAEWEGKSFSFDDNLKLTCEKSARVLRKLILCCDNEIFGYSSLYDGAGYENFGKLHLLFKDKTEDKSKKAKSAFIPRNDQKKLLEYSGGKTGVNAVPGAGKTTVLTELIIKLVKKGISPSNIFVLTYMESAAATFRERIKSALPEMTELPNISTIHGLAFRIIRENNNYTRLFLPDNIEIADDNTRQKILTEVIINHKLSVDDRDDYEKAISAVKLSPNGIKPIKNIGKKFAEVYESYNKKLSQEGFIDYDDMLKYAVQLISEHKDIRDYYADLCVYVIEDEAQDSSEIQQKLLTLLSSKHNNLLRVGDINQAITSSFTDSDPKSFKKFFSQNNRIEMNTSQRSSIQIQKLANDLIKYSLTNDDLKDSFYNTELKTTSSNPKTNSVPEWKEFENSDEEKLFIINKIKKIYSQNEKLSVGILLRNNFQVQEYAEYFSRNGIKVSLRSDLLSQKSVFRLIFSYLKFLRNPFDNKLVEELAKEFKNSGIIRFTAKDFEFIQNLDKPFISMNVDNLESENIIQFWWNIEFKNRLACLTPDNAAVTAGLRYFTSSAEKSNIYLISAIIQRLMAQYSNEDTVLNQLEKIASKPLSSSFKFFDDENSLSTDVKIMTVHKSKGDEFDVVFIPEFSEENYSLDISKIKTKSYFVQTIKDLRYGHEKTDLKILKKEQAEETLRLIYVGITRAKKELYISFSKTNSRKRKFKKSVLFDIFRSEE